LRSPDGVGWQGFYFDHFQMGGICKAWSTNSAATGKLSCEKHVCIDSETGLPSATKPRRRKGSGKYARLCKNKRRRRVGITPYKGVCDKTDSKAFCDKSGAPAVCSKMQVIHVNQMSRSAGVLVVKRSSCDSRTGKCSVFKAGLCIDVRKNVWSSSFNAHPGMWSIADKTGGMMKQAKRFGKEARKLLKKYNNKLPKKYHCSDHRHKFKFKGSKKLLSKFREQGSDLGRKRIKGGFLWQCFKTGCLKTKDATLARFAIINF